MHVERACRRLKAGNREHLDQGAVGGHTLRRWRDGRLKGSRRRGARRWRRARPRGFLIDFVLQCLRKRKPRGRAGDRGRGGGGATTLRTRGGRTWSPGGGCRVETKCRGVRATTMIRAGAGVPRPRMLLGQPPRMSLRKQRRRPSVSGRGFKAQKRWVQSMQRAGQLDRVVTRGCRRACACEDDRRLRRAAPFRGGGNGIDCYGSPLCTRSSRAGRSTQGARNRDVAHGGSRKRQRWRHGRGPHSGGDRWGRWQDPGRGRQPLFCRGRGEGRSQRGARRQEDRGSGSRSLVGLSGRDKRLKGS